MLRNALFLLGVLLAGAINSGFAPAAPLATYSFGMSLMTGMNSELFTLFVVKEHEGQVINVQPITRGQFIQQAQGTIPSPANPSRIDFFRKYEVSSCFDSGNGPVYCNVFDHLWKLRFFEYPFKDGQARASNGWAESPFAPSARQFLLLSDYGIHDLRGIACGEDLFRLLHDVGDESWVDNYRKGY